MVKKKIQLFHISSYEEPTSILSMIRSVRYSRKKGSRWHFRIFLQETLSARVEAALRLETSPFGWLSTGRHISISIRLSLYFLVKHHFIAVNGNDMRYFSDKRRWWKDSWLSENLHSMRLCGSDVGLRGQAVEGWLFPSVHVCGITSILQSDAHQTVFILLHFENFRSRRWMLDLIPGCLRSTWSSGKSIIEVFDTHRPIWQSGFCYYDTKFSSCQNADG